MLNTVVQHSIVGQHAFQVQVDPLEKSGPEAVWTFSGFYLSPKRSIRSGEVFFLRWSICVGKLALVACGTPLARDILTKKKSRFDALVISNIWPCRPCRPSFHCRSSWWVWAPSQLNSSPRMAACCRKPTSDSFWPRRSKVLFLAIISCADPDAHVKILILLKQDPPMLLNVQPLVQPHQPHHGLDLHGIQPNFQRVLNAVAATTSRWLALSIKISIYTHSPGKWSGWSGTHTSLLWMANITLALARRKQNLLQSFSLWPKLIRMNTGTCGFTIWFTRTC